MSALLLVQVGIITDIWLWHGALVDVLADFKGWVRVFEVLRV